MLYRKDRSGKKTDRDTGNADDNNKQPATTNQMVGRLMASYVSCSR